MTLLRASALSLWVLFVACDAEPGPGDDAVCAGASGCPAGARCVGGRCVAASPADGGRDGGADVRSPGDVVSRTDVGPALRDVAADAPTCRALEAESRISRRPVDLVLIVDTSASTGGAPARVAREINAQLAAILDGAMVDYRVILLASSLSIGAPLSTSGRLFPVSIATGSGDDAAFLPVLQGYSMWRPHLRPGVKKVFIHFTDSVGDGRNITGRMGPFDQELYRLDPANFGAAADGLVTYHAVIGLAQRTDMPTRPWLPSDPVVTGVCASPEFRDRPGSGPGFQELAIRTGGVRFPICLFANFDVLFRLIADSVVEYAAPPCVFELPTPPMGTELNLRTVVVRYRSGDRSVLFRQVGDVMACTPGSFFITGGRITLCPDACAAVRADRSARVSIAFGCDSIPK